MSNKLYILTPVDNDPLWEPWYDKAFGFVVCAETAQKARKLAAADAGDETDKAWLDAAHSYCRELKPTNKSQIIMQDFAAA